MVTVEISVRTLEAERERLREIIGGKGPLYAQGAVDAITWMLQGGRKPSEWASQIAGLQKFHAAG